MRHFYGIETHAPHTVLFLHWNSAFQFILRFSELQQVDRRFQAALLLTRPGAQQCSLLQEFASLRDNISHTNNNISCLILEEGGKIVQQRQRYWERCDWSSTILQQTSQGRCVIVFYFGSICASARSLVGRSNWSVWVRIVSFTRTWWKWSNWFACLVRFGSKTIISGHKTTVAFCVDMCRCSEDFLGNTRQHYSRDRVVVEVVEAGGSQRLFFFLH